VALDKHAAALASVGANPDNGLGAVLEAVRGLPADQRAAVEADIAACFDAPDRRGLAMAGTRLLGGKRRFWGFGDWGLGFGVWGLGFGV